MTVQLAIDTAFASGKRAGLAMFQKDQSRATAEREWFQKFRNLWKSLPGLQPSELDLHYGEGYKSEARGGR